MSDNTTKPKEEFVLAFAFFTQVARECGVTVSDLKKMFTSTGYKKKIYNEIGLKK